MTERAAKHGRRRLFPSRRQAHTVVFTVHRRKLRGVPLRLGTRAHRSRRQPLSRLCDPLGPDSSSLKPQARRSERSTEPPPPSEPSLGRVEVSREGEGAPKIKKALARMNKQMWPLDLAQFSCFSFRPSRSLTAHTHTHTHLCGVMIGVAGLTVSGRSGVGAGRPASWESR